MDRAIAGLAARQHNVVALAQLVELGLSEKAVSHRIAAGRLHLIHRGVYAVGSPRLSAEGHLMAAVLACGPAAALSHRSAASHLGVLPDARMVDVTAPGRRGRSIDGIRAHACALTPADLTEIDDIPCTSLARTLLDVAGAVQEHRLRSALRQAEILGLLDVREVEAAAQRVSRPRGVVTLRRLIAEFDPDLLYTESELEGRFLALCRSSGLPAPEINVPIRIGGLQLRPDCLWRRERLVVELDGARFHSTPSAVERDKRRDQRLLLAGWTTVRCTWSQVEREPDELAETIRGLLVQRARSAT